MLTRSDILLVKALATDKTVRYNERLFIVEGAKCVGEVLASHFEVARLWVTAESQIVSPKAETVSPKEMGRLSALRTPTDELAVVRIPEMRSKPLSCNELVLALDDVQDPGNLGTIVRIADWYGISRVICSPRTADCFNPKVVQASMGALLRVEVSYGDLEKLLREARSAGIEIYGTALDGEDIYSAGLSAGGVVIMGNEGHGISAPLGELLSRRLFIPPYPSDRHGSESLNVAIATAVVCNEFRRRMS